MFELGRRTIRRNSLTRRRSRQTEDENTVVSQSRSLWNLRGRRSSNSNGQGENRESGGMFRQGIRRRTRGQGGNNSRAAPREQAVRIERSERRHLESEAVQGRRAASGLKRFFETLPSVLRGGFFPVVLCACLDLHTITLLPFWLCQILVSTVLSVCKNWLTQLAVSLKPCGRGYPRESSFYQGVVSAPKESICQLPLPFLSVPALLYLAISFGSIVYTMKAGNHRIYNRLMCTLYVLSGLAIFDDAFKTSFRANQFYEWHTRVGIGSVLFLQGILQGGWIALPRYTLFGFWKSAMILMFSCSIVLEAFQIGGQDTYTGRFILAFLLSFQVGMQRRFVNLRITKMFVLVKRLLGYFALVHWDHREALNKLEILLSLFVLVRHSLFGTRTRTWLLLRLIATFCLIFPYARASVWIFCSPFIRSCYLSLKLTCARACRTFVRSAETVLKVMMEDSWIKTAERTCLFVQLTLCVSFLVSFCIQVKGALKNNGAGIPFLGALGVTLGLLSSSIVFMACVQKEVSSNRSLLRRVNSHLSAVSAVLSKVVLRLLKLCQKLLFHFLVPLLRKSVAPALTRSAKPLFYAWEKPYVPFAASSLVLMLVFRYGESSILMNNTLSIIQVSYFGKNAYSMLGSFARHGVRGIGELVHDDFAQVSPFFGYFYYLHLLFLSWLRQEITAKDLYRIAILYATLIKVVIWPSTNSLWQVATRSFLLEIVYLITSNRVRNRTGGLRGAHVGDFFVKIVNNAQFSGKYYKSPDCPICLDDFDDDGSVAVLPCGHGYHSACINAALGNSPLCPVCRAPVHAFDIVLRKLF